MTKAWIGKLLIDWMVIVGIALLVQRFGSDLPIWVAVLIGLSAAGITRLLWVSYLKIKED